MKKLTKQQKQNIMLNIKLFYSEEGTEIQDIWFKKNSVIIDIDIENEIQRVINLENKKYLLKSNPKFDDIYDELI